MRVHGCRQPGRVEEPAPGMKDEAVVGWRRRWRRRGSGGRGGQRRESGGLL